MTDDVSSWHALSGRRALLVVLVVAALALSGCSALSDEGSALPDPADAAEGYRTLDGYSATVSIERSDGDDRRIRIWVDPDGGKTRSKVLAPPPEAGDVYVANTSRVIRYNATTNEYVRISTVGTDRFERGAQRIKQAIADARAEGETTTDAPPVGGQPLPVVPDKRGASEESTQFVVRYEGTESIAGRTAHVLNYTAAGDRSQGVLRQRIWLDTEYFVTLKATQVSRFGGNRSTYTFELSNVSFDPDFGSDRFEFDPPAGATVNRSESFDVTSYDSRSALAAATRISVPTPAVPDRYSLVTADRIEGVTFDAIQLRYRAGTSALYLTKTTEQTYTNTTEGEPVTIGNQTGRYRSSGVQSLVVWECGDYVYTVVGDLQKATMIDIARSVACR
jgi:outer membrane lipoprotein-sorting protein